MKEETDASPRFVVVIGASAGGLQAVTELLAQATEEMDAAFLLVLHAPNLGYTGVVLQRLQRNTVLTCKEAEDGEPLRRGYFYLSVPDQHLLLKQHCIRLGRGAVENRWRPSIDALFRSAAVTYNSRVIGVVLSGLLDDGMTGMQFIKSCGGVCMVQDPAEAEYPDLPKAVLDHVPVDYCTGLRRIGILLQEKTRGPAPAPARVPPHLAREAEIAERVATGIDNVSQLGGQHSVYSCPQCGGGLWELNENGNIRFRCHTGHQYSATDLLESKRRELENAFWVALRVLEERRSLLLKMADEEGGKGWQRSSQHKQDRAAELEQHIRRIKEVLFDATNDAEPTEILHDEE